LALFVRGAMGYYYPISSKKPNINAVIDFINKKRIRKSKNGIDELSQ
jgi:hypothetical protein